MNDFSLKLDERTATGKAAAKLRADEIVPSVVYGGKSQPLNTQSPLVPTTKIVHGAGKHSPVHLTIDGKKKLAIIKSVDIDPVKHQVRHVAFHTIKQNDVITAMVPIRLTGEGESEAEKAGLVVLQALEQIEIKAKPADLPNALELSIAGLAATEDKLTLADLKLPEGVEYADLEQDTGLVVANVYEPSALQAANEAAAGEAEEPTAEGVEAENGGDAPQEAEAEEPASTDKDQAESN